MRIDENLCIACGSCVPYCPMKAISLGDVAVIDQDECVECGVCARSKVCPVDAFVDEPAPWPRSVRAAFSNPTVEHKETRVAGRGTEEMKTNEITGLFKSGWIGMGFEFGRPGIGSRFRDVEKVTQVLAPLGVIFADNNPVTKLMVDKKTGKLTDEVLDEKVMSAIIECVFPIEKMKDVLRAFTEVAPKLHTVVSVECINKVEPDDSLPMDAVLKEMGIARRINGKTNVGLGRPLAK
ncbi:MAG: 4Fe-4S binding protein [Dehalococcoidia bacterium]|nr:4Fe-4S binding protein [Dehalococcoidia bacterium]